MGYYIRILAQSDVEIPPHEIERALEKENTPAIVEIERGDANRWFQLSLLHRDGEEIAFIERDSVSEGELGAEEIEEFLTELETTKPESAARWLKDQLRQVKVVYAFQILGGADTNNGWDAIHTVFGKLRTWCNGISQADGEGFSNHEGSQITWQFAESAKGEWQVAILDSEGNWRTFRMNLENAEHRAAFLRGQVPPGVEIL